MSRIALMHVSKQRYYKLPGGGINSGEDIETALKRELFEEVGVTEVEIVSELGMVCEYRDEWGMKAEHYGFIAKNIGDIIEPELTRREKENCYETVWVDGVDKAIELVESGKLFIDKHLDKYFRKIDYEFNRELDE